MTELEKQLAAFTRRCRDDARDLNRSMRGKPPGERLAMQTHANVKEAVANDLDRIVARCAMTSGRQG